MKVTEEQMVDLIEGLVDKYNCTDSCVNLLVAQIPGFEKNRNTGRVSE